MNWKEAVYVHLIENRQKNMNGKSRQMLLKIPQRVSKMGTANYGGWLYGHPSDF